MQIKTALLTASLFLAQLSAATLSKELMEPSLIVYSSGLGVVHESRELTLEASDKEILYGDVAQSIDIDSISIKTDPRVQIFSQQYRFDQLTKHKLLQAHIGKKVEIRRLKSAYEYERIQATLLAHSGDECTLRTLDYQIVSAASSDIIFETIPDELITKPSLLWNIETPEPLKTTLELNYIINQIGFSSNYILFLDANSSSLSGWISIDNRSGKSFSNTQLALVAGDVNRVNKIDTRVHKEQLVYAAKAMDVKQEAFEGYHYYTIPFRVSLANNEKTQIKFLQKENLNVEREYEATLTNPLYLGSESKVPVMQYATFKGLDAPLPKGVLRTYGTLHEKTVLLGESSISHTPKGEQIKALLGKNFDLSVTQKPLKLQSANSWISSDVAYSLRNASDAPKEITLLIPFTTEAGSIVESSQSYTITKGNFVTFKLLVDANSTQEFTVHFESRK